MNPRLASAAVLTLSLLLPTLGFSQEKGKLSPKTVEALERALLVSRKLDALHEAPERLFDDALADEAKKALGNFFYLQRVYLDSLINKSNTSGGWATARVREQSQYMQRLIPLLEAALQRNIQPENVPPPGQNDNPLSYEPYSAVDGERKDWELAQAATNLTSTLAYAYRARRSKTSDAGDLDATARRLPKLREDLLARILAKQAK